MAVVPLLAVTDLRIACRPADSCLHMVNGVSYSLEEGEALGIASESGRGKSVSAQPTCSSLTILRSSATSRIESR